MRNRFAMVAPSLKGEPDTAARLFEQEGREYGYNYRHNAIMMVVSLVKHSVERKQNGQGLSSGVISIESSRLPLRILRMLNRLVCKAVQRLACLHGQDRRTRAGIARTLLR